MTTIIQKVHYLYNSQHAEEQGYIVVPPKLWNAYWHKFGGKSIYYWNVHGGNIMTYRGLQLRVI